ncbi:hypothetical protein [Variovorax saccharolyticus]|uniref:hypothetical protein n=1 Tax=Variovorax saccharolyticus TaxID=3053516 RepID=UPI002578AB5B|nr:hypothetical protein [Variovorax sp. J31P216]MDM0025922.1 hypothetical protein [Variovorax sp. J31P216]
MDLLLLLNSLLGLHALEAIQAALKSAIQVGLNGQVLSLDAYPLAPDAALAPQPATPIPHSEPSDKDQVVEEYMHSGMQIEIYRNAGLRGQPTYFAVVSNPAVKSPTGAVIDANSDAELKKAAEVRAERKAVLWKRSQDRVSE